MHTFWRATCLFIRAFLGTVKSLIWRRLIIIISIIISGIILCLMAQQTCWNTHTYTDGNYKWQLKLIGRLRTSRWTPPDYWQTDNSNGLVLVIRNYYWLNSALISTCSAPPVQTGERKQFSLFDLDLWPTTLTYTPRLAKVKIDPHAKNQGQRSNGSNRRVPTDKRTLPNILSSLLRGR